MKKNFIKRIIDDFFDYPVEVVIMEICVILLCAFTLFAVVGAIVTGNIDSLRSDSSDLDRLRLQQQLFLLNMQQQTLIRSLLFR